MYYAETGLKGGNRACFSLEMTFRRIDSSKRIISFILNTPMERPIFGSAYSYYCFRRQICTPLSCLKCWIRDKKIVHFGLTINCVYG